MEGMFNGRGNLDDNVRMLTSVGAKYIGRSLCLWGAEADFLRNIERAKAETPKMLTADPDAMLEACVFETVSPKVEQIAIPDWVFTDLASQWSEEIFRLDGMTYPEGQRRDWGRDARSPMPAAVNAALVLLSGRFVHRCGL